jgi:3-oxoacyl-[acyl-carrier protein] reductase
MLYVIVGGSKGLGRVIAGDLARRGHEVVIAARHADALQDATASIRDAGGAVTAETVDLASYESIDEFAARIVARRTPLRALIIAAAGFYKGAFGDQATDSLTLSLLQTFVGPARLVSRLIRECDSARPMDVILVTAVGAATNLDASRSSAVHVTAKAALHVFGATVGRELLPTGVRVTTIAPGTFQKDGAPGIPREFLAQCVNFVIDSPPSVAFETIILRPTGVVVP